MTVKNSERQTINETKMKYWYSHVICCSPIMILAFIMLSVFIVLGTKETVKAATEPSATFDAETGTLTISGTFSGSGSDVANKIMRLSGTPKSNVKKVIAESGTVFGYSCSSLFEEYTNCTEIDLSNANTDHVETMYGMFQDCTKLETLKLNNFNTSKVSNMASMFRNCSNLTELDLSSFDTSYVKNMDRMFAYCSALKTIYVSESFVTTQLTSGDFIFSRCNSIVGGNGTKYQAFEYNVTYARIDKAGSPGYFTKKHVHSFSYSSSGNVLTAKCGESDCHLTDSSISLTLTPPTSVTDAEHTAVTLDGLEDFNSETGQNISQDDITYYNTSGGSKTGAPLGSVPVTAGTYCAELTVSGQTASLIYDLNLAPTANTLTYTGSSQVLITDGSAADGYAFQYRLGTDGAWSPTPPTETEAGEYAVYYYLSNTSDSSQNIGSEGSPYGSIPVTIAKADAVLTTEPVGNTGLTYDGNAQELLTTEGAASGGTVYYRLGTGGTWTTTPPQETTAGNYTIYYYVVGDSNHSDLGSTTDPLGSVTARMEKKSLRVKAQDQTITYGNQISQDSANYVLSTEVAAGDSASVKLTQSIPARKITPSVTVRRNGVDVSNCYAIVRMSGDLTVNPTTLTVTADAKLKYYLQDDPALTYGVSGLGYSDKASSVLTGVLTRGSEEALGTYAITQGNLAIAQGYTDFYNLTFQGADFTISAKPVASPTIKFVSGGGLETDNYSTPYTGVAIEPEIRVYDGETLIPANEYTVAYTNNTSTSTDATKASVTVTDNADGNYILTETSANYMITKIPANLDTAPTGDNSLTYNGGAQTLLSENGVATGGTISYRMGTTGAWTTTPPQATSADDYTVYYYVEGDENHSDLGSTTDPLGSVTARIAKATVTVSGIIAQNKEYDENTVASFDDSLTMTGAVPTEELQVNVEGVFADSKPGNDKTVTITNVTLSGATKKNYTVSYDTTATLTASITIADGTTLTETVTQPDGTVIVTKTTYQNNMPSKIVETTNTTDAQGNQVMTVVTKDGTGTVTGATMTTTSSDGKTETVITEDASGNLVSTVETIRDTNGNVVNTIETKTNADGTTTATTTEGSITTVETKDASGNTTKTVETKKNADGTTTIITTEGSTTAEETKDASGNTTKTVETKKNADGTTTVTTTEGNSTTVETKDASDNTTKVVETKTNVDGTTTATTTEGSTTTVETKDASDNTTRIVETKKNADGTTTVTTTEGSITTVETKDAAGNVTKTVEAKTNADETTTVTITEGSTTTVETKDASDNTTKVVETKTNANGTTTVTTTEGSTTTVETIDALGNTTKTVDTQKNSDGTTTVTTTEGNTTTVETKDESGNTTKTVETNKNADGKTTVTTTEGNKTTVETQNENNKITKKVETINNSDGTTTVTETLYDSEGNKTGSTETTTSADGKTETAIKKDAEGNAIEDAAPGSGEEKTDESGKNPIVEPGGEQSGDSGNEPKNESGDKTNTDKQETKSTASDAKKNEINTKLNDLIAELKKVIDSLENLTDEQKVEANKKLDSVVDIAKTDVSNAASDNAAQSVLDNVVVETKSVVVGAVTKDIQKQAENAKAEIDNTKGLTNSQKKALKAEVDSKANEAVVSAVKSIDSIATNTVSKSNADTASQTSSNTGSTAKENADTIKVIKSDISEKIAEAKTDAKVQAAINKYATPKQIEKNSFSLNEGLKVDQKGKKIIVKWGTVSDADGYDIYVQYCGKKFTKKACKTVKKSSSDSAVITKIGGKKFNVKKNFKVYVNAYKKVSGKKITLGTSITAHVVGVKNKKYTNAKDIKITSHTKIDVYIGTKYRITADTILVDSKKKQLSDAHAKEFRYASTDKSIATVSKDGYITGKKAGEVIIWVYARNGYGKKIQVTVK